MLITFATGVKIKLKTSNQTTKDQPMKAQPIDKSQALNSPGWESFARGSKLTTIVRVQVTFILAPAPVVLAV